MNTAELHPPTVAGHGTRPAAPTVTLVTTAACHFCEDAHRELLHRTVLGQLTLDEVAADSARGQALLALHRPALFPLVLFEGAFFSAGRLPRRKLDRTLAARNGR